MPDISMAFNYSMFKFPFKSENVGRERGKLQKFEYEDNEKSFFCKIESIFYVPKGFLLVIYIKTADRGLNVKYILANIFSHATCLQFKNDCSLFRCLY